MPSINKIRKALEPIIKRQDAVTVRENERRKQNKKSDRARLKELANALSEARASGDRAESWQAWEAWVLEINLQNEERLNELKELFEPIFRDDLTQGRTANSQIEKIKRESVSLEQQSKISNLQHQVIYVARERNELKKSLIAKTTEAQILQETVLKLYPEYPPPNGEYEWTPRIIAQHYKISQRTVTSTVMEKYPQLCNGRGAPITLNTDQMQGVIKRLRDKPSGKKMVKSIGDKISG